MSYPDNVFPADPEFPAATNTADFDYNFVKVAEEYLSAIAARVTKVITDDGNVYLPAAKIIFMGGTNFYGQTGTVQISRVRLPDSSFASLAIGGDAIFTKMQFDGNADLTLTGNLSVSGYIGPQQEINSDSITLGQQSDPPDPATNESVIWLSHGGGAGDVGDLMMKINYGGVTKTTTLIDFA